jgi:predicted Zn-dependent peptidase
MLDRTVAPTSVAPGKFRLPEPDIIKLSNGSNLYTLVAGDQPVIKLEFVFKAGIRFENTPGIAFCTAKMLTEGTQNYDSKAISEALDQYGAFVEVQPGFDHSILSIHVTTGNFHKIETVLSDILFRPVFPADELELLKQIQIQQIKVNEQKNSYLASRLFRAKLYPDFPYGHVINEENIGQISTEMLHTFYKDKLKGKFDIFLTGQFDDRLTSRLMNLIDQMLEPTHDFPPMRNLDDVFFQNRIEKEESLQSAIYMGRRCLNRKDKLYPQLLLLNEIFGGYFGSRLMQNIREDKGLSYSIHSHIASMRDDAYFVIGTDVKKETTDQALEEIAREIEKIKSEPIGRQELLQAKNHLKGSVLNALTTPFALTEKLKNIYLYDLGLDYYDRLFDGIDSTDSEDLLTVANESLFSQPLSSVVVG